MSSSFDADFAAANGLLSEAFGEEVTLARATDSTAGVTASIFSEGSEIQTQSRMGVKTSFVDREWLIKRSEYLIDSVAVTPARGDRLVDSEGTTWELMDHPGLPAVQPVIGGVDWLVRTKRIATA